MKNKLLIQRKQVSGGIYGDLGNKEQNRYAVYELFKTKDFDFFHMHISEDIEIHRDSKVLLFQLKRSQSTAAQVRSSIKKYLKFKDFMSFIVENKGDIDKWYWISNVEGSVLKSDIFKGIKTWDTKNEGVITINKSLKDDFLATMKSKFKFKGVKWLKSVDDSDTMILNTIQNISPRFRGSKVKLVKNAENYITRQEERQEILKDEREYYDSFSSLRGVMPLYSKKEFINEIKSAKAEGLINQSTYNKLLNTHGVIKARMYIQDRNKKYARERIKAADVSQAEVEALWKELYDNK